MTLLALARFLWISAPEWPPRRPLHAEAHAGTVDSLPLGVQGDGTGCAACTGDGENTLILAVQIQHGAALHIRQVHGCGTQHPDLLVHGNDHFQRRVRNGIVVQNGQGIGDGNAVITAQGGSLGKDAASIMGHVQTIHSHIQGSEVLFRRPYPYGPCKMTLSWSSRPQVPGAKITTLLLSSWR